MPDDWKELLFATKNFPFVLRRFQYNYSKVKFV